MQLQMLKSKIHRAKVTGAELDYEGSITIDSELIEKAGFLVHEKVLVVNLSNGARIETYVIPGEPGEGTICMNGAAAHHFNVDDLVIIMAFVIMDEKEAESFEPVIVKVDESNKPK